MLHAGRPPFASDDMIRFAVMSTVFRAIFQPAVVRRLFRAAATIVLAFFLAGLLLRWSPGWNAAEQDMDPRFSTDTVEIFRKERSERRSLFRFYPEYLRDFAHGNAGNSELFDRPVTTLIAERAGTTARTVCGGVAVAWVLALFIAAGTARDRTGIAAAGAASASAALLSIPAGLLAVGCLLLDLPPAAAVGCVVFPRVFPHAHEQFRQQLRAPHSVMARAQGIGGFRLFRSYVVPGALPPLAALAGVSVPLAFGASIPIEALADSPGLGQLTWRAALGRDMPLLVSLTLLLTVVSVTSNLLADRTR
jgi:peptide/nickel transport system permease protein